ncbi:hypothetical protein AA313_de0204990 [Arthrobotrys entomopaga]|nr:hypothetical protein AA313_de0204990 [Arthrobotrys entomopaga]
MFRICCRGLWESELGSAARICTLWQGRGGLSSVQIRGFGSVVLLEGEGGGRHWGVGGECILDSHILRILGRLGEGLCCWTLDFWDAPPGGRSRCGAGRAVRRAPAVDDQSLLGGISSWFAFKRCGLIFPGIREEYDPGPFEVCLSMLAKKRVREKVKKSTDVLPVVRF